VTRRPLSRAGVGSRPGDGSTSASSDLNAASRGRGESGSASTATSGPSTCRDSALVLAGLGKSFGSTRAVDGLDLVVPAGAFYGLVGPNGAGKTTTLSMAVGLLRPDAGRVTVFDTDVWVDPVKAKTLIGVLPDAMALPERLTGTELLTFHGRLRGLPDNEVHERADELLEVLDLARAGSTMLIDYSTGMRKKIGLASALLHAPRLLVLDEPFEAVDPVSAATVRTILRRFVASGGSVVFSSHVMAVVEEVCDEVAVIVDGRVAVAGPMDAVRAGRRLEEVFVDLAGDRSIPQDGLAWLRP
jgi:ABC-2 type transport system ATP-binding protein